MKDEAGNSIDILLRSFVIANDDEADRVLEALFADGIDPIVTGTLRHKLHISLRSDDGNELNQIGIDLAGDVRADLLIELRRLRADRKRPLPENFAAYVRAIARHAYGQYLREKHPNRLRLTNKVRYILSRKNGYATWRAENGELLCGTDGQKLSGTSALGGGSVDDLIAKLSQLFEPSGEADDNRSVLGIIKNAFELSAGPIRFEALISVIWQVLALDEPKHLSAADAEVVSFRSKERGVEGSYDERVWIGQLWKKVSALPLRHRRALLLSLSDRHGDNLIALFPAFGIASIRQIANVLDLDHPKFAAMWNELPLNDQAISGIMGLTRQQVINLRQSARASLRRKYL